MLSLCGNLTMEANPSLEIRANRVCINVSHETLKFVTMKMSHGD